MTEDERAQIAARFREAGRQYQLRRAAERAARRERRAITYRFPDGMAYRLLPGQRITIPLANGDTLTLCGEQ